MGFRTSAIIPTYNRPEDLKNCIQSILNQTVKPDEIIIIDDGNLNEVPLQSECEQKGIDLKYVKKKVQGVCQSRNLGVRLSTGDILFLLEDDIVLLDDFFEQILKTFEEYSNGSLGGVGGVIHNIDFSKRGKRILMFFYRMFLLTGLQEGKILRSGFSTDYGTTQSPPREVFKVDFLTGGGSAFRKEVFDSFRFSERYQTQSGYAQGEDKEFSYRVSKEYNLLINPDARFYHYPAEKTGHNKFIKGKAFILSRYLFFKECVKKRPLDWVYWIYAVIGYLLIRTCILMFSMKRTEYDRVRGILSAVKEILFKRRELERI
nr:glycosyltransferase [Desulfobacterales bacterium]